MKRYDLAIVGAGLGGLAAAALMARQKRRTVLLEPGDSAGGLFASVQRNGFVFSPGKTLSFGFERGGTLQKFCADLGIHQNTSVLSPCYQIALPDRRVSIFQETEETMEELTREFPGEGHALRRFYQDLRALSERIAKSRFAAFRARRRKARSFLAAYRFSNELHALFDVQSRCFYQCSVNDLSLQSLISLVDTAPLSVLGGFSHFAEQVLSVFLQDRGEIRYGAGNVRIIKKEEKAEGIAFSGEDRLEAGTVLINNPSVMGQTTAFFGIQEEVVPVGMAQEVLCLPDYIRPELLFTLSLSQRDQETVAPRGTRTLTASFPMLSHDTLTLTELTGLVETIVPFFERFIQHAEMFAGIPENVAISEHKTKRSLMGHECGTFLKGTRLKNLFQIDDSVHSPYCAVSAARRLVERIP